MLKGLNIGLECPDFNGWPSTENVIAMIFCDDDAVVADKNYKYHLHTIIARHNAQRSGGLWSQKCIPVSIWQVYFLLFWGLGPWGNSVSAPQILPCSLNKSWERRGAANDYEYGEVRFTAGSKQASRALILTTAPCLVQDTYTGSAQFLVLRDRTESFWLHALSPKFNGPSNQTGTVLKWSNVSYLWC